MAQAPPAPAPRSANNKKVGEKIGEAVAYLTLIFLFCVVAYIQYAFKSGGSNYNPSIGMNGLTQQEYVEVLSVVRTLFLSN